MRRSWVVGALCAVVLVLPPTLAYAYTTFVFWPASGSGTATLCGGCGGYTTGGYNSRDHITIYRPLGNSFYAEYQHTDLTIRDSVPNSSDNPFQWLSADGYATSWCWNNTNHDVSSVTCYTTKP